MLVVKIIKFTGAVLADMNLSSYVNNCIYNEMFLRWPKSMMPLPVYIAPFRWYNKLEQADNYIQMVMNACKEWQDATNGLVSFKFASQLNDSLINIVWRRVDRSSLGKCRYDFDKRGILFSSEIEIGLSDGMLSPKYQDPNEVYRTILHEIGHSIGIADHSPYKTDIMYAVHQYGSFVLSDKDKRTLNYLYKIPEGLLPAEFIDNYKDIECNGNIDVLLQHLHSGIKKQPKTIIPQKDMSKRLDNDRNLLADMNRYNLSLQNIRLSPALKDDLIKFKVQNITKKP